VGALLPQALPAREIQVHAVAVYPGRVASGLVREDGEVGWD